MKHLLITLATCSVICSCKKDETEKPTPQNPPVTYPSYSIMKTGNYWIYQHYNVTPSGLEEPLNKFDSCYVEKDTLIGKNTYAKVHRPNPYFLEDFVYLRDSAHYIVGRSGARLFSSEDFTSELSKHVYRGPEDTIALYSTRMTDKNVTVNVPAGAFITSNVQGTYKISKQYAYPGYEEKRVNTRYAKGVGIVVEALPVSVYDTFYTERRLVRYSVK